MKYLLLIYGDEEEMAKAAREGCYEESADLAQELAVRGQYLAAHPLQPVATATSIRVRSGKALVTDGPFAEGREQLGGYFLVETGNLDEAIKIAERIPSARYGMVEIRPVVEIGGMPEEGKREGTRDAHECLSDV